MAIGIGAKILFGLTSLVLAIQPSASQTIVDVAVTGQLNTLVAALKAAGLAQMFQEEEGPFTVFAPTDKAFSKLPAGALEMLLANPEKLGKILAYHVAPGAVTSDLLADGMIAPTLLPGKTLLINLKNEMVKINGDAMVMKANVEASNGVVHIIDKVLMPPMDDMAEPEPEPMGEPEPESEPEPMSKGSGHSYGCKGDVDSESSEEIEGSAYEM